jgi:hypothetical protein
MIYDTYDESLMHFVNIFNIKNVNKKTYRYVRYGYHAYLNLLYGQTTTQLPATFLMSATLSCNIFFNFSFPEILSIPVIGLRSDNFCCLHFLYSKYLQNWRLPRFSMIGR